jgi:hypothetical protein
MDKEWRMEMYYPEIVSGTLVRFELADVVCPESDIVLQKATGRLEVTGRVVLLSDAGKERNYYAVVQVKGIATPLIVPVNHVEIARETASDPLAEFSGEK